MRVDGATVDIPSYAVSPGAEIAIAPHARELPVVKEAVEDRRSRDQLTWLGVDYDTISGRMLERPSRADIPLAVEEQLIVELYSK